MGEISLWFFALSQKIWLGLRAMGRAVLGREGVDRLMDKSGLRELKNRFWRFKRTLPDGTRIVYRPHDQCIVEEIYEQKAYGAQETFKPGETVVDVGGHIGSFALYAARLVGPRGTVVVCEPSPDNLVLLRKNLALNALPQIHLHACALADRDGEAALFIPAAGADNPAANTLFETPGRKGVRVPLRTLDAVVDSEGLTRIDHLKIDVEGAELMVLKGGRRSLKLARRVVMEIHPGRVEPREVLDFLEAAGFRYRRTSETPFLIEALK